MQRTYTIAPMAGAATNTSSLSSGSVALTDPGCRRKNEIIQPVTDSERGCGWRKEGGIYLVTGGIGRACGRFPFPLDTCPTCGSGIKPSRGFTWVNATALFASVNCNAPKSWCITCPTIEGRVGLIWIGEAHYKTPLAFTDEAARYGISRRISHVPKDFEIGITWVLCGFRNLMPSTNERCLASYLENEAPHKRKNLEYNCQRDKGHDGDHGATIDKTPGIFYAFRPSRIEYVVKGDESDEEIAALEKRGLTCVKVTRRNGAAA